MVVLSQKLLSKSGIVKFRHKTAASRHILKLLCRMDERLYISCSIYFGVFRYVIKNSLQVLARLFGLV